MRLRFDRPHLSITGPVSDEELPNFLVIVGRNGSGKTHLLEAISNGACQVEPAMPTPPVPQPPQPYGFNRYGPQRRAFPPPQPARYVAFGGFKDFPRSLVTPTRSIASIELFGTNVVTLKAQHQNANDLKIAVETSGLATKAAMDEMELATGKSIVDMTEEELKVHAPPVLGVHDPFNVALADLFVDFLARREELDQANYRWERGRSTTRPMSLEEFDTQLRPPWDVVNDVLADMDFPFRVDPPRSLLTDQYSASFTDVDSGAVVSFEALSAGEKVLVALALLEYTAASEVAVWRFPSLVLLDEPDVGLHPALVERLVNVLDSVLVQR